MTGIGYLVVLMVGLFLPTEAAVQEDLEIVAQRLRSEVLVGSVDAKEIREHLEGIRDDGSWPDIDYDDRSRTQWLPRAHLRRLISLARAYRTPGGALEGSSEVRDAFLSALRYWTIRDPDSDNWIRRTVNGPDALAHASLLMIDEIPTDLLDATGRLVRRSGFTRTGANLVWESSNLLAWACVTQDPDLLHEVVRHIAGEIRITTEEGIQHDASFHQHGPQNYVLGYGRSFASSLTDIAVLLSGTVFAFPEEKIRILSSLILDGQQWFVYGRQMDYHGMGREAFRGGPGRNTWNARRLVGICENMRQADPSRADAYEAMSQRMSGTVSAGASGPLGNKHFWRSDTMVHRAGDWYASVRFHSTRTYHCEVRVNRENLRGYHLADGVMFFMRRGDEYHELQPVWDYRKLPGLTFVDTEEPLPFGRRIPRRGTTDFVGGVSDGTAGVAVMDFSKDDVQAKKAYFFTDRGIVCLGSGISSARPERVFTTLNQSRLRSEVTVLRENETESFRDGQRDGEDIRAVWHDGTAYVILEDGSVAVKAESRSGAWNLVQEGASTDVLTEDVFTCTIDHGSSPSAASYAYRIVPDTFPGDLAGIAEEEAVRLLANTPDLQAVHVVAENLVQAVFHVAGSMDLPDGSQLQIDTPCALQVRITQDSLAIAVADPSQASTQIGITIQGRYTGEGAGYSPEANQTRVGIDLPTGPDAGRSVPLSLSSSR